MIIGSEPVSIEAITTFNAAFAPYGLPPTAFKPSYGIAEATLFVATIAPHRARDGRRTSTGINWPPVGRVRVAADAPMPSRRSRAVRWPAASGR